jgi:hypothetical protein
VAKKAQTEAQQSKMNMVKPCSKDSKSIVYKAFENEFKEVVEVFEKENSGMVTEYQADEIMVALGFINPQQNGDLDHSTILLNYLRGHEKP